MDTLHLEIGQRDDPSEGLVDAVEVFIVDRNLKDLAREGTPNRAGSYVGLPVGAVLFPSRRLLGESEDCWDDWEGRISVLGCGVVGCWPFFRQPHRKRWRHDDLEPFVFERKAYEAALLG